MASRFGVYILRIDYMQCFALITYSSDGLITYRPSDGLHTACGGLHAACGGLHTACGGLHARLRLDFYVGFCYFPLIADGWDMIVYPVSISTYDFNAEEGRTVTFEYAFEDGVPTLRKDFDPDGFQTAEIEYNGGRVYKIDKMNSDGLYHGTQYFQFANRDAYFTFVLHENHYAAFEDNPGMTMEETDSISVVTENGLLRSTTNTGMYANWNDGEEKVWQRFSGTYAAGYDANGILSQTDAYHRVGSSGTENKFGLTKENGSVVEAIRLWKDYATGEWTGESKFEFEYTDIETTPARFAAMINSTILGETNNYYYYFWY